MAGFPAKKNAAHTFGVGLVSQANPAVLQANPTLAAGDVKVSIDGGAFTNLTTLPTVTPAAGKRVQVSLSAAEMNGDVITVLFSDASGDEWNDLLVDIQTSARQVDDLAYPATSGRSLQVESDGHVHADLKEWLGTAPLALSSQQVQAVVPASTVVASVTGAVGSVGAGGITSGSFAAGAIDAAAIAAGAITSSECPALANLDAAVSTRLAAAAYAAPDNASITSIKAKTDALTFTVAGGLDANVRYVNSVAVGGAGTAGSPWGPA